jgi:NCS1 family nucleobase:cation symporter-1
VVLVDLFIRSRHQGAPGLISWRAVAAWLIGVAVAVPFVDSTLWQSPLAVNLLHNTDISGYVGALVGGAVYLVLGRRP